MYGWDDDNCGNNNNDDDNYNNNNDNMTSFNSRMQPYCHPLARDSPQDECPDPPKHDI